MQGKTLLITAKNKIQQEEALTPLLKNHHIDMVDTTNLLHDGSIGITEIRLLQKNIFFKPIRGEAKACIVYNAHTLTIEAQNALLKLLEEPPDNTLIILLAQDTNAFLPTVLSRCTIISVVKSESLQPGDNISTDALQNNTIGQKLKLAEKIAKNKDSAILWLEEMILSLRQEFIKNPSNSSLFINRYSLFQKAYVILKTTNTNPRLTLENLFLNLPTSI